MNNAQLPASDMKGAVIPAEQGPGKAILELLKKLLIEKSVDGVIVPVKVPAGDSFTYVLINDVSILDDAMPLAPIMPVSGAKAVSSITRVEKEDGDMKIAAVMRPCEISAAIELAKLEQVNLKNMVLIGMDCPGVLPMADFISDPEKGMQIYETAIKKGDLEPMRPVCQTCHRFGTISGDIHMGISGMENSSILIIPNSAGGRSLLDTLGLEPGESIEKWAQAVGKQKAERLAKRDRRDVELDKHVLGPDNLFDTFGQCINCHNCMRACPICYCQQCYFDSENVVQPPEDYLRRAKMSGSVRFLPDTFLFHTGRLMHMAYSCVSCGCCEDACPVSIPVAQIFSKVGRNAQELFNKQELQDVEE